MEGFWPNKVYILIITRTAVITHIAVILAATVLPSSCQQISPVANGQSLCPGEKITLTCVARRASIISWRSVDYISRVSSSLLSFADIDTPGSNASRSDYPSTVATLTSNTIENGERVLTSELRITVRSDVPSFTVACLRDTSIEVNTTLRLLDIPGTVNITSKQRENRVSGCTVYYSWSPPNNIDVENVDGFIINFNGSSERVDKNENNVYLMEQSVCSCASHDISISAVDRCQRNGTVGEHTVGRVSDVTCEDSTTAPTNQPTTAVSGNTVVAVSVVSVAFVVLVVVTLILMIMMCFKVVLSREKNGEISRDVPLHPASPADYDEKNEEKI